MALIIKSKGFNNGGLISSNFTCDGQDISPELEWENVPASTKSLALIMDDPDAPRGTWDHWILFNIPAMVTKLESNIKQLPEGTKVGKNSWGRNDYGGPCPPDREHRYFFKLYALDTMLNLESGVTKQAIEQEIAEHVIEYAEIICRYNRISNK
ncbi:Phosphatidylethanolamine-binding protein [Rickettsiales bacterium Ac37b]|nr:Phosphatidylethanolamine-binding protein [Rickettsiales bacterium Ac37b]